MGSARSDKGLVLDVCRKTHLGEVVLCLTFCFVLFSREAHGHRDETTRNEDPHVRWAERQNFSVEARSRIAGCSRIAS